MAEKINIQFEKVYQSVSNLDSTSKAMEHSLPSNVACDNVLDLVEKINQICEVLTQQGEEYKQILKMNNDSVRTVLDTLEEADNQLSASIGG